MLHKYIQGSPGVSKEFLRNIKNIKKLFLCWDWEHIFGFVRLEIFVMGMSSMAEGGGKSFRLSSNDFPSLVWTNELILVYSL